MLTEAQIKVIQSTWEEIAPNADMAAVMFYESLFKANPKLEVLFAGTKMEDQRTKLVMALSLVIRSLENLSSVIPVLRTLGQRHVGYGVKEPHYAMVGDALMETLQRGLGDGFTPEAKEAWTVAFGIVSAVMLDGAKDVGAAA